MPEPFNEETGTDAEIMNYSSEEIEAAISTVDFELTMKADNYSEEELISDYIGKLFKKFEDLKTNQWENAQTTLRGYIQEAEEGTPDAEPPEDPNAFQGEDDGGELTTPITGVVSTQGGNLNLRSGPGTNNEVVGKLKPGTEVSVVGYDESGDWAKINIDGKEYYVSRNYLKESPETVETATSGTPGDQPQMTSGVIRTNGGNLNFRSGPGTNNEVMGTLKPGTEVNVVGYDESGNWAKINIAGKEYYVSKNYLENNTNATSVSGTSGNQTPIASGVVNIQSGNLNFRSGPGTNNEVMGTLKPGTEVSILGYDESGEWAQIDIGGQEYYVSSNYIKTAE